MSFMPLSCTVKDGENGKFYNIYIFYHNFKKSHIVCLLCARHCSRLWGHSSEQNKRTKSCPHEAYVLAGKNQLHFKPESAPRGGALVIFTDMCHYLEGGVGYVCARYLWAVRSSSGAQRC